MAFRRDIKGVSGEESIVDATAYAYTGEVLVEVTSRDADGHLVVHSYAFRPEEGTTVTPLEAVPDRHASVVGDALAEKGLETGTDAPDAGG